MRNSEFKTIQNDDIVYVDGVKCYCSRTTRRNEVDCFDFYKYGESNDSKNIIATVTLLNRVKISPEKYTCEDFKSDAPQFSLSNVVMKKIKTQSDKIKSTYKNLTKVKPPKKKTVKIPEYITNAKKGDILYVNGVECVVDSNQYIRSKDAYPHDINISIYRGRIYGYVNYDNISNKPPKERIDFKSLLDGDILYVLGNRCYCQIFPRTQNEHMTVLLYKETAGNCSDPLATLTITNLGNVFTISPGVYIDDISSKRPSLLYYIKQIFKKKEVVVVDETITEVESLLNCRLS